MHKSLFWLSLAGFLFSGYMSGTKFFSGNCAFNEQCPLFLGYPSCYFGFLLFTVLFITALLLHLKRLAHRTALYTILITAFLGVLFAGWFTLGELPLLFENGLRAYFFGLPTCALGLLFYVAVGVVALKHLRSLANVTGDEGTDTSSSK